MSRSSRSVLALYLSHHQQPRFDPVSPLMKQTFELLEGMFVQANAQMDEALMAY